MEMDFERVETAEIREKKNLAFEGLENYIQIINNLFQTIQNIISIFVIAVSIFVYDIILIGLVVIGASIYFLFQYKLLPDDLNMHEEFNKLFTKWGYIAQTTRNIDNAKEIRFYDFIAYRDDVMLTLTKYGLDRQKAFLISEQIRKGKGFTNEQYDELLDLGVPNWYLDLCNKIEYLFPKAHCAEYVRLSFILAYYKTHFRTEFEKIAEEYKVEESEDE